MKNWAKVSLPCDIRANGRSRAVTPLSTKSNGFPGETFIGLREVTPCSKLSFWQKACRFIPPFFPRYDLDQNSLRSQSDRSHAPRQCPYGIVQCIVWRSFLASY